MQGAAILHCEQGARWDKDLTCAAVGALAVEGGYPVVAGGPVEAGGHGAVIDVLAAVLACPAVDADAVVAAVVVVTGAPILAGVGHQLALIHVFGAVLTCQGTGHLHEAGTAQLPQAPRASLQSTTALPTRSPAHPGEGSILPAQPRATPAVGSGITCPLGWALAVVGVDAVHAGATILAVVAWTVIDVLLAVLARKPCAEVMSAMMPTDQPAVPLPQPPASPPPTAGCLLSGAEHAPTSCSQPSRPVSSPAPSRLCWGLALPCRFPCQGTIARAWWWLPPRSADWTSPAWGSPAKAPGSGDAQPKRRRIWLHGKPGRTGAAPTKACGTRC